MANTSPRRKGAVNGPRPRIKESDAPWRKGDPTKRIGLNTPIGEPLMLMLDYLIENRAIYSKASFIREVVASAAEKEVARLWKVREAMEKIEQEDRSSHRSQKPHAKR